MEVPGNTITKKNHFIITIHSQKSKVQIDGIVKDSSRGHNMKKTLHSIYIIISMFLAIFCFRKTLSSKIQLALVIRLKCMHTNVDRMIFMCENGQSMLGSQ